jgi:2-(1,2-epoxy-1,2-dihydrophenyl)acetyl-CoA isomerase
MQLKNIIYGKKDHVAMIRLNRPEAYNAFNFDLFGDLNGAMEDCTDDNDVRAVVITGQGKAFSAGGDVVMFNSSPDPGETLRQLTKLLNYTITSIREMPKPAIAMINGTAAGVGMSVAAACDMRICAESAKFRQAYTSIGLIPDGAWTLLVPLLVGFGKAQELVYLDPIFSAAKALEMGFVNRVVADSDLENTTVDMALKLTRGPMRSYAMAKENFNQAMLGLLERQLEVERCGLIRAGRTADAREGIAAFLEKREPVFRGL